MQVYGLPDHVQPPDFEESMVDGRYDMKKDDEVHEAFFERVREYLRNENGCTGPLTGEMVYFPIADGKAVYMVGETSRTTFLVHLPIHDAWQIPDAHARGLRKSDIKQMVEADKRLRALFAKNKKENA